MLTEPELELELATNLAHNISLQAEGTKDHERLWIAAAARLIERLLSGSATRAETTRAHAHLHLVLETATRGDTESARGHRTPLEGVRQRRPRQSSPTTERRSS